MTAVIIRALESVCSLVKLVQNENGKNSSLCLDFCLFMVAEEEGVLFSRNIHSYSVAMENM